MVVNRALHIYGMNYSFAQRETKIWYLLYSSKIHPLIQQHHECLTNDGLTQWHLYFFDFR
ncbi:MAG: hypothetical protein AB4080_10090 [Trichodesmium sp.]